MSTNKNIKIIEADLSNPEQANHFLRLTAGYMEDIMGQASPWTEQQKIDVINDLKDHPLSLILFATINDDFVGVSTCFFAYSTFMAKPLLNIHDIFVAEAHRGQGVARQLLQAIEEAAKQKKCGKITLEVRKDNLNARDLYRHQGYTEAPHSMFFWLKQI